MSNKPQKHEVSVQSKARAKRRFTDIDDAQGPPDKKSDFGRGPFCVSASDYLLYRNFISLMFVRQGLTWYNFAGDNIGTPKGSEEKPESQLS